MIINIEDPNTQGRYSLICADPPWQQSRGGVKAKRPNSSGKPIPYETLSLDDIATHLYKATELCEENSVLFLWTIDKYLFEARRWRSNLDGSYTQG